MIGSKAIKRWFEDFPRTPKDVDYIVDYKTKGSSEIELLYNPILYKFIKEEFPYWEVASPDVLYTLKMSHVVGWDINWEKHLFDIQFLKKKGCKLISELFYELYEFWNTVHQKNKRSELNMSSEMFFDNAIKYPVPHDIIHTFIKNPPTFTKVLVGEVEVSESLFNELLFDEKCDLVTEEVMVMAAERFGNLNYRNAYSKMLKKFTINHAPLWEAIFIIENFPLLEKPSFNFLKIIEDGCKEYQFNTSIL